MSLRAIGVPLVLACMLGSISWADVPSSPHTEEMRARYVRSGDVWMTNLNSATYRMLSGPYTGYDYGHHIYTMPMSGTQIDMDFDKKWYSDDIDQEWQIIPSLPQGDFEPLFWPDAVESTTHVPGVPDPNAVIMYSLLPGYAQLKCEIWNFVDPGEYQQGSPLHVDPPPPLDLTMDLQFVDLQSFECYDKGTELYVFEVPEHWVTNDEPGFTWSFNGFFELTTGVDPSLSETIYEPLMDWHGIRGCAVSVSGVGARIVDLPSGDPPPGFLSFAWSMTDVTQFRVFSIEIVPSVHTPNAEIDSSGTLLWYLGLPLYFQVNIWPNAIEDDYISQVSWIPVAPTTLSPVPGMSPESKYRRALWWETGTFDVKVQLSIGNQTSAIILPVSVADWFYFSDHGTSEIGLGNFNGVLVDIGSHASKIISGFDWELSLIKTSPFVSDSSVNLPSGIRATPNWIDIDIANFDGTLTSPRNCFWKTVSSPPYYSLDPPFSRYTDTQLQEMTSLLFDFRGHHPLRDIDSGVYLNPQQVLSFPSALKNIGCVCWNAARHSHGSLLLGSQGSNDPDVIAQEMRDATGVSTWHAQHYAELGMLDEISVVFEIGDFIRYYGNDHLAIVIENNTGLSTRTFSANNSRAYHPSEDPEDPAAGLGIWAIRTVAECRDEHAMITDESPVWIIAPHDLPEPEE
jgi:hypothetical protein